MEHLTLDPKNTALVLIDLQKGIAGRTTAPHAPADVIANAVRLADAFRTRGSTVVLVRVAFAADGADRVSAPTDVQFPAATMAPDWADIVAPLGPKDGDLVITKHQWGAFYGTELDLQLRRRGTRTIVLGGIATNFGVESTARDAFERSYALVFAEDATSAMSSEAHEFAMKTIFPRLGLVRSTSDVLAAFDAAGNARRRGE